MFARLNGFIETGTPGVARNVVATQAAPPPRPPPVARAVPPLLQSAARPSRVEENAQARLDEDPARREVAERVLETAAELEGLIKAKSAPPPKPIEEDESLLEDLDDGLPMPDVVETDPQEMESSVGEGGGLFFMAEGGELDKVTKDRFVIGRGKHCD